MGLIRDDLKPCPICGRDVLGVKCEYNESFAYIQCNHCRYEFAAQRPVGILGAGRKKSNYNDTVRLWNALPRLSEALPFTDLPEEGGEYEWLQSEK